MKASPVARELQRTLLALALAVPLSGCWLLRPRGADGGSRLAAWRIERLAVVPFADATYQGVGGRVSSIVAEALAARLGAASVTSLTTTDPDIGFIGVGQAQRLGKGAGVQGLVVGQVLAHGETPAREAVRVVLGLRLLDATRGSIIWTRTVPGTVGVSATSPREAALDRATALAAKEFIDDLSAPAPDVSGRSPGLHDARRRP